MISREQLPDDPLEWKGIDVSFPRLGADTEESSPRPRPEVFDYICRESADSDQAKEERLKFLRTAQVGEAQYWLWSYEEEDGEPATSLFEARLTRNDLG
jgi:hypothetical protein